MEPPESAVDVLVIGAGITGIYQLYRAREAGFSTLLLEAGDGVGGTWFWNRYPGARFDSESYTYAYLFSKELFDEWEWQEHFAQQPETERYLNHVVDRFDLRRHMRFGATVRSAVYDESSGEWTVVVDDGTELRTRFLIAATGVLSVPYFPDVPGREDFLGESHHTGRWPATPVDFAGKRVAVVGTGSSGVQLIPSIAGEVASLTVYQRTANWCTPLNNAPITPDEQAQLRADFEAIRETLNTSASGFLHTPHDRATFDDSKEERLRVLREDVEQPRLLEAHESLHRLAVRSRRERGVVRVHRRQDPQHRQGSRDRGEADPEGPPLRREAAAVRDRLLRGLQQPERLARRSRADADRAHDRARDRDGRRCAGVRHRRVGDRLRLRHRRAPAHGDPRPGRSRARGLLGRWSEDVPRRADHGLPELLLPRRPARGGRQQSAVQRRPGRLRHRHARVRATTATTRSKSTPRPKRSGRT